MPRIYLIGSLKNAEIPKIAVQIRELGYEVFDDWFAPGPEADDWWKKYEGVRGRTYEEALKGFAARHIFEFDKSHIDRADVGILILPAGKSGHMELGYMIGKGKPGYVLMDRPDRWDIMYQFSPHIFFNFEELAGHLKDLKKVLKDMRDMKKKR